MATPQIAPPGAPLRRATLDNGLKVLVRVERTAPLASVWCWYRVGSKDERLGLTGVSHWVEHMNFKGTANIPRDQVKGIIEQFGGTWNGYTSMNQTTYVETATRDALDRMLFIESERMASCLYDPADCESERTVIISELEGGDNDPEQLLDQELTATAFKVHPYRQPTIGWLSDLRTMTRDDLYNHYRQHYLPNNATLVIVGDVDADQTFRDVERHFGGIKPGTLPDKVRAIEPDQTGERRVRIRREGTAAYLKVGYHAPAASDPLFVPALVLDAVLTGAKGVNIWSGFRFPPPQRRARLYRALVEGRLASTISGAMLPTAQPFLYMLSATATEGTSLGEVEAALLSEVDTARREGMTAAELVRAKTQLRAQFVFDNDSVTNIAHQIGYFDGVADVALFDALPDLISAVTPDEVAAVAHGILGPDNRTVGWFEPIESDVPGPHSEVVS